MRKRGEGRVSLGEFVRAIFLAVIEILGTFLP